MKSRKWTIRKGVSIIAAVLLLGLILIWISPLFDPSPEKSFTMPTNGMRPTIVSGDRVVADMKAYDTTDPGIGDLVIFIPTEFPERRWVFRIAAAPGDTLEYEEGVLTRNAQIIVSPAYQDERVFAPASVSNDPFGGGMMKLKEDEYFMLSDDPEHFNDSRAWGAIPRKHILGKVVSHQ